MLFAMLAIALQAFVVQPHVHAFASSEAAISAVAADEDATKAVAACAICRLAASAREFTTPPDTTVPTPSADAVHARVVSDRSVRLTLQPAWRSRAPPLSLA